MSTQRSPWFVFAQAVNKVLAHPTPLSPARKPAIQISPRALSLPAPAVDVDRLMIAPHEMIEILRNAEKTDFPIILGKFRLEPSAREGWPECLAVDTAGRTCALKVPLSLEERFLSKFKDEAHLSYVSGGSEKMVGIREMAILTAYLISSWIIIDGQNLSELADNFLAAGSPLKPLS